MKFELPLLVLSTILNTSYSFQFFYLIYLSKPHFYMGIIHSISYHYLYHSIKISHLLMIDNSFTCFPHRISQQWDMVTFVLLHISSDNHAIPKSRIKFYFNFFYARVTFLYLRNILLINAYISNYISLQQFASN